MLKKKVLGIQSVFTEYEWSVLLGELRTPSYTTAGVMGQMQSSEKWIDEISVT